MASAAGSVGYGDHWAQSLDLGAIDLLQRTSDTIVPLVSGTFDHQGVKAETVAEAPTVDSSLS